jgi:hypothetical protein
MPILFIKDLRDQLPTACAVGLILAPLRGWVPSAQADSARSTRAYPALTRQANI